MTDVEGCLACDLTHGRRPLPGGAIHETAHWRVEHCVGPLGVGTLLVKPLRHVLHVAELTGTESTELGPLLKQAAGVVADITRPEQVYVCLWSHADKEPGHVHFVVQPVTAEQAAESDKVGPFLQTEMFLADEPPDPDAVETFAANARSAFTTSHTSTS